MALRSGRDEVARFERAGSIVSVRLNGSDTGPRV